MLKYAKPTIILAVALLLAYVLYEVLSFLVWLALTLLFLVLAWYLGRRFLRELG